jgi:hypothetical protein
LIATNKNQLTIHGFPGLDIAKEFIQLNQPKSTLYSNKHLIFIGTKYDNLNLILFIIDFASEVVK